MIRTLLTALSTVASIYVTFAFYQLTIGDPSDMPLLGHLGFVSLLAAAVIPGLSYIIVRGYIR